MKRIILFVMACVTVHQTFAQINPLNAKDSVQITGKIIGYDPNQANHFITFSTNDLFGKSTSQAIQIEDNGSFWIKLYQPFEGDMQLSYKDAYINIYTKPNQVLQLDIYDSKVKRETHYDGAFIARGELASINNLIFKFKTTFDNNVFQSKTDMGDKKQSDSAYAASMIRKLDEQLTFLNSFIKSNLIIDQKFINWQRSLLQYEAAKDILFFPFAGKYNKDITQKQLLQLINTIPINNEKAYHNSAYYGFLSSLCGDQQIMININPMYDALKVRNGKNTTGICLDEIDKFAVGLARQLMYYYVFLHKAGSGADSTPYLARFNTSITNPFLKEQLLAGVAHRNVFKKFNVVDRLNALKVSSALKQRLISLFTNYEGTSLYIDFWGDWCGPCMSELPNYPKLITTLAGKPIKFLFLSTFTTDESMLAIKDKFKINGDFVNLTKDEVSIVNNVFEFHSYPFHFMINDKGEAVDTTWKMSSTNIQQKVKEIEQFLLSKQ
ncbi:MAG: hypothetical protein EON51_14750 [Acinetobacter sp.]|nr:MAG: hypothetical protein EON51_14750 [Acinetobacter sp.]